MLTLGLSGGLDLITERRDYLFPLGSCHDAAAVLAEDGRIIAAIEEERLTRIKHTSKGAVNAIRFCLDARSATLDDVDELVYYGAEDSCNRWMRNVFYGARDTEPVTTFRQLIHDLIRNGIGERFDDRKLRFVDHHLAHAISAYSHSGFSESLVVTIDGAGDGLCGSVTLWRGAQYQLLATYADAKSLGILYDRVIPMIGFGFTEEYKVMGLAPYGDPARFRRHFESLVTLLPEGDYVLHWHRIESLYDLAPVRKKGDPILQEHMDIAASLQEVVERVVFHLLTWFRVTTGMTSLCLAGGVAHNSTLNGRILYSGMFREVFVQPASHDAGCAIGAALFPFLVPRTTEPAFRVNSVAPIESVYWGTSIGTTDEIGAALTQWNALVDVQHESQVARRAATLLADGEVIGWVQGRSEFGPRALGNRSILADPRPASHKELINTMVKKREGYRPFAPAVLEECAAEYFELPTGVASSPFMSFTLRVKPEARQLLGATTHVDHTARTQTVSRSANPAFWELIDEFRQLTGVAVLLNTSFNNNAEPIVDSVDDAVCCFLTTGLNHLVVGEYVVCRRNDWRQSLLDLSATLPSSVRLNEVITRESNGQVRASHTITNTYSDRIVSVSSLAFRLLRNGNRTLSLRELLAGTTGGHDEITAEFLSLWEQRVVVMRPVARAQNDTNTQSAVSDVISIRSRGVLAPVA